MNPSPPPYTETIAVRPKAMFWLMGFATLLSVGLPLLLMVLGEETKGWWSVVLIALFMAGIWWLLLASKIKLRLDEKGVHYQYWPLRAHFVPWQELQSWYLRELKAFSEFGGWGMRWGFTGKSWGYVTNSPQGLQLHYKSGRKVVISTLNPDALKAWLDAYAPALFPAKQAGR